MRACYSTLAVFKKEYYGPGLQIDFQKREPRLSSTDCLSLGDCRRYSKGESIKMWKWSLFIARFVGWCTGWLKEALLRKKQCPIPNRWGVWRQITVAKRWNKRQLTQLKYGIEQFKRSLVSTFSDHCISGLYTLKFHLLGHVVKALQAFGRLSVIDAKPFEQCSVDMKNAYRQNSKWRNTCISEPVRMVKCRMDWTRTGLKMHSLGGQKETKNARSIDCWRMGNTWWEIGKITLLNISRVLRDN